MFYVTANVQVSFRDLINWNLKAHLVENRTGDWRVASLSVLAHCLSALSSGSTQEDSKSSQYDWNMVDWDVIYNSNKADIIEDNDLIDFWRNIGVMALA